MMSARRSNAETSGLDSRVHDVQTGRVDTLIGCTTALLSVLINTCKYGAPILCMGDAVRCVARCKVRCAVFWFLP